METNRRISEDELSQKLVNARKVMSKVDSGNFERGAINEKMITSSPEELVSENAPTTTRATKPMGKVDPNKIRESKLPEAIKQAMIDNPIPQIGLDSTLDMNFTEKTKKLMEQDGFVSKPKPSSNNTTKLSSSDLEKQLTPIIENIIRKTLDDIFDRKIQQILTAHDTKTINEGLAIKVGDSIFTGKLTKVKSTK